MQTQRAQGPWRNHGSTPHGGTPEFVGARGLGSGTTHWLFSGLRDGPSGGESGDYSRLRVASRMDGQAIKRGRVCALDFERWEERGGVVTASPQW